MKRQGPISRYPPGFHFTPTDQELIVHYLKKKLEDLPVPFDVFKDVNLYVHHPEQLVEEHKEFGEGRWYFFTSRDRKYPNGLRPNRTTANGNGYWKATGTEKQIKHNGQKIGVRRSLVYYTGKAGKSQKTDWIMQEYICQSPDHQPLKSDGNMKLDSWVLCTIQKKRGADKSKKTARKVPSSNPSSSNVPISSSSPSSSNVPSSSSSGSSSPASSKVPCSSTRITRSKPEVTNGLAPPSHQIHHSGWSVPPDFYNKHFTPATSATNHPLPSQMKAFPGSAPLHRLPLEVHGYPSESINSAVQDYPSSSMKSSVQYYPSESVNPAAQYYPSESMNPQRQYQPLGPMNSDMQGYTMAPFSTKKEVQGYTSEPMNSAVQGYASENFAMQGYTSETTNSAVQGYHPSEPMNSGVQDYISDPMNSTVQYYPSEPVKSAVQEYPSESIIDYSDNWSEHDNFGLNTYFTFDDNEMLPMDPLEEPQGWGPWEQNDDSFQQLLLNLLVDPDGALGVLPNDSSLPPNDCSLQQTDPGHLVQKHKDPGHLVQDDDLKPSS